MNPQKVCVAMLVVGCALMTLIAIKGEHDMRQWCLDHGMPAKTYYTGRAGSGCDGKTVQEIIRDKVSAIRIEP